MNKRKNSIIICLIIGLCFLWTGSGYLTWLYHLMAFYPSESVDFLTEVVGYLFQVCGLVISAFMIKQRHALFTLLSGFVTTVLCDFILIFLSTLAQSGPLTLLFGYGMNLFHGLVAGYYLMLLVTDVPQQNRGIVFGLGYGVGSIGSWLLSLIGDSNFLQSRFVLIPYAILIGGTVLLFCLRSHNEPEEEKISGRPFNPAFICLAAGTVFLLSLVKNLGFYFPSAGLSESSVSLEFTRAFYAIGLITAGLISDKNRRYSAICCLAALVFPFISLFLVKDLGANTIVWIVSYIFFGFFTVFRVILFTDLAGKTEECLFLAGCGLLWGRAGDVVGAFIGMRLAEHTSLLILLVSTLFILTVFVFFAFYHKLYVPNISAEQKQKTLLLTFEKQYDFSSRERDVFELIVNGQSNSEIAGNLFISENTVKFHIKNILRKTQCANRTELIRLFSQN